MHEYIPISDAAKRLGVNTATIRRWCDSGLVRHTKIRAGEKWRYFVHVGSFEELIRQNEVIPAEQPNAPKRRGRPNIVKIR